MKLLLTAINAKYIHSSLSQRYLKKYNDDLPLEIKIREFTINNYLLEIADQIFDEAPDILGLECYIWNIELVKQLLPLIKKMLPKVCIICGGPEISYHTEKWMQEFPEIDYVLRGEGEETLHSFLCCLLENKSMANIAGLAQRINGEIKTSYPVVFENIDKLPFPYDEKEIKNLQDRIIYYETSRGCPFSCKYCLSCATKGVRYRSLDKVLQELDFFAKEDVKQVKFVDRTFNAWQEHFLPILEFIQKQDCRTNFHFEAAIDYIDKKALALLAKMPVGRVQLEIGIQSTNERTLRQVSRQNNWDKIASNIKEILSHHNIHVHTDLIIGLPYEDMQSLHKSFNDMYTLAPDMLQVGFLKLLKGAAMEDIIEKHGYIFTDTAPYQVISNKYLTAKEMRSLRTFVDVFDLYYNSGRFKNSLQYLIGCFDHDAFAFFRKFSSYWHEKKLDQAAHSPKALYRYLADFTAAFDFIDEKLLYDFFKLDAICSDHGRFKPDFLDWSEKKYHREIELFWKSPAVHKYLPNYRFVSRRTTRNKYHIEIFSHNISSVAKSSGKYIFLFIYEDNEIRKIPIDKDDLV